MDKYGCSVKSFEFMSRKTPYRFSRCTIVERHHVPLVLGLLASATFCFGHFFICFLISCHSSLFLVLVQCVLHLFCWINPTCRSAAHPNS